jgi:hypothetical protein
VLDVGTGSEAPQADALNRNDLRHLIEELIDAQVDGARLAKRVMLLQDLADAAQTLACAAYDEALDAAGNPEAVDRAVMTASSASRANEDELDATIAWKEHLQHASQLVDTARVVLEAL